MMVDNKDSTVDELIQLVQGRTTSHVTANFIYTLKRLAVNNKDNLDKFLSSCNSLGNFKDEGEFLKQLHGKLIKMHEDPSVISAKITGLVSSYNSESESESESGSDSGSQTITQHIQQLDTENQKSLGPSSTLRNKKLGILRSNIYESEDEDEHEDAGNDNMTLLNRHLQMKSEDPNKKIIFKKIEKSKAMKLNEYADSKVVKQSKHRLSGKDNFDLRNNISIPHTESFMSNVNNKQNIDESDNEFLVIDDLRNKDDNLEDEREWYNHDDDYGNAVGADNILGTEKFIPENIRTGSLNYRTDNNNLNSEIQLLPLPIEKRKELLPSFIKQYETSSSASEKLISTSLLENDTDILINPFRNPESEFSINAKKGSFLVAQRRKLENEAKKNRKSANIAGTSLGEVIGIKDTQPDANRKNVKDKENISSAAEVEMTEDIEKTRKSLPVYKTRPDLLRLIRENQVVIIIGETGSGKTTQLAQYLFEDGYCSTNRMIGCTQPRRVAAMSVAKRVAVERGVNLGDEVGYSIRFEDKTSAKTKIKFLTDGILLREFLLDNDLERYSAIIIDEAHERSLNTDIIMGLFKNILSKRRDLKLIITSATLNATKFSDFFGNAPKFKIPGRTFPVELIYSKHAVSDYVQAAVLQAVKTHMFTKLDSGDILIFMTGQEDIEATSYFIKEKLKEVYAKKYNNQEMDEFDDLEIFPIYSALPADVQSKIFKNLHGKKRKIVIATNIAETSLTIDGIRYVIDCGYSKLKVFNAKLGLDSLSIVPIALSNASQRSGRAGRTQPGVAYRLYTEESASEDMYPQAIPEIQRTNLSNTILMLKSAGINNVLNFPFIDKPPLQTLLSSLYDLWFIGALDNYGNITSLGSAMAKFPILPSLSKMLLTAITYGCSAEILTIVSLLSVSQIFQRPKEQQEESDKARTRFFVPESDHLTLLNVFSQWKSNKFSHKWCNKNFVNYRSLVRALDIRTQLIQVMKRNSFKITSVGKDWDIIRKCICSGYTHQSAKISGLGKYTHLKTGIDLLLHPTSALFGLADLPPYVVYHELLVTSQEYICCVTAVDPFWLMQYGLVMYNIKRIKESTYDSNGFYAHTNDNEDFDDLDIKIKEIKHQQNLEFEKIQNNKIINIPGNKQNTIPRKQNIQDQKVNIGFKRRRPL
ncbi:hypothetical protein TPHA_0J01510 [Tetrapisispora phaffii CBS 4417]|uniref:RNA helicase n=1 Tax=Tetrapisispora phaffii (strain ATCC 24235 / CBS 4417 / NBRC 1672 / NRRL Y-8282 / UCD 70-5) TaxID=1071381 RepID=G8BYN0_TETPH|nr:hypothetical protein TPHA_0J01510 [Tetrapisispora phaffii CBS 4417]CCE64972.1 hypothetical protein TPHA_0J01510 [Tetrapisispora phaffii CBS 4417]